MWVHSLVLLSATLWYEKSGLTMLSHRQRAGSIRSLHAPFIREYALRLFYVLSRIDRTYVLLDHGIPSLLHLSNSLSWSDCYFLVSRAGHPLRWDTATGCLNMRYLLRSLEVNSLRSYESTCFVSAAYMLFYEALNPLRWSERTPCIIIGDLLTLKWRNALMNRYYSLT